MSLLYWFPCTDGTFKNQGLNNTQLTNISTSSIVSDNNGKLGKCVRLAGAVYNDNFTALSTNNYSISYWIKYGAFPTYNEYVVCINGTDSSDMLVSIGVQTSNGTLSINASGIGTNLSLNTWYHICYTHTGSTGKIYLNGNLIKTLNITGNINASHLTINGRYGSRPLSSQDYINDLRIYNHTLSAKEVEEVAKGLILHYKLNNNGLGGENIITNSSGYEGTTHWTGLVTQAVDLDGHPYLIAKRTDTTSTSRTFCTHSPAITSLVSSWNPGDKFTLSGYYKVPSSETQQTSGNMFIRWSQSSASNSDTDTGFTTSTTITDTWIRFEYTYTVPPNFSSGKAANFYLSAFAGQKVATVYWKDVKMELGEKATLWSPAKADVLYVADFDTNVYDCSGYGNNGTVVGTLTAAAGDSPRYDCSTHFECSDPTTNNTTGLTYIKTNFGLTAPTQMTTCWWGHPESGYGGNGSYTHASWCTSANDSAPTDYNATAFHHRDNKFDICLNSASSTSLSLTFNNYTQNEWHYYCVTYDGKIAILYKDGVESNRSTISSTEAPLKTFSYLYIGYSKAGGVHRKTLGSYSDFRIYATALSAAAIKELYDTSGSIDAQGNIYARELVEL